MWTNTTKHALLVALAHEHGADVQLRLGVYLMDASNTPGIAGVLDTHESPGLPEAHCYLAHRGERVDATGARAAIVDRFLRKEAIKPGQIDAYKVTMPREFLQAWSLERGLDPEHTWRVRKECIVTLSGHDEIRKT